MIFVPKYKPDAHLFSYGLLLSIYSLFTFLYPVDTFNISEPNVFWVVLGENVLHEMLFEDIKIWGAS